MRHGPRYITLGTSTYTTYMSSYISFRSILPLLLIAIISLVGCGGDSGSSGEKAGTDTAQVPVIGYVQLVADATLDEARNGFYAALAEAGYSDSAGTVKIIYRNAQGEISTLPQIIDYFIAEKVTAIATNPTVAMINAVGKTSTIPIFMMVAPKPDAVGIKGKSDSAVGTDTGTAQGSSGNDGVPPNLSGVYETLEYIDTSVALISQILPTAKRVGTLYNSSEPNSMNALERLRTMCAKLGLTLVERPVTSTNETQQVMTALIGEGIDVFFALPDNVIFGSFETVHKAAMDKKIPIVTSESGLVKRGAFIGYGADFFAWGHQAGVLAAKYLKTRDMAGVPLELVVDRRRTYNPATASALGLPAPAGFAPLNP